MATPSSLVSEILEFLPDKLPARWESRWQELRKGEDDVSGYDEDYTPYNWLRKLYFTKGRNCELTEEDIFTVTQLVTRLLKLDPAQRSSAREIGDNPWFQQPVSPDHLGSLAK